MIRYLDGHGVVNGFQALMSTNQQTLPKSDARMAFDRLLDAAERSQRQVANDDRERVADEPSDAAAIATPLVDRREEERAAQASPAAAATSAPSVEAAASERRSTELREPTADERGRGRVTRESRSDARVQGEDRSRGASNTPTPSVTGSTPASASESVDSAEQAAASLSMDAAAKPAVSMAAASAVESSSGADAPLDGAEASSAFEVPWDAASQAGAAALAVDPAQAAAAARTTGSASAASGSSSIKLIAQPGGELGMSWQGLGSGSAGTERLARSAASAQAAKNTDAVVQAATRGISSALMQRGGTITIRLIPETLGALRVQVKIDEGSVSVRLEATNAQAAELLQANAASLRQSLEARGMQVERIQVVVQNAETPRASVIGDAQQEQNEADQPEQEPWSQQDEPSGQSDRQTPGRQRGSGAALEPADRFGERLRFSLDDGV